MKGSDPLSVRAACVLYRWALRLRLDEKAQHLATPMLQTFRSLCLSRRAERSALAVLALAAGEMLDLARSGDAATDPTGVSVPAANAGRAPVDSLLADARVAARLLRRRPGFTVAALATLTLAIGSTTAIFAIVDNLLLRPLPFPEPERLVELWSWTLAGDDGIPSLGFELRRAWKEQSGLFDAIEVFDDRARVLMRDDEPEQIQVTAMTHGLFELLGARPAIGRPLIAADAAPDARPVALLSDGLWRRLGADETVAGQTMRLDDTLYDVIGVMPPSFAFPYRTTDLWVALPDDADGYPIGRLAPGVEIEAAQRRADELAKTFEEEGRAEPGWGIQIFPLGDNLLGIGTTAERTLWVIFGAVGLLLLIAIANVANLVLSQTTTRRHELSVREALGAGRARIVRQLLIEAALLGLAGAALGTVFALVAVRLTILTAPERLFFLTDYSIVVDARVMAFAATVAVGGTLAVAILPALQATAGARLATLGGERGHTASRRQQRLRGALVVAEVAIAAVLLVGAGLLVRSMRAMLSGDPGFDTDVMVVTVNPSPARYRQAGAQRALVEQLEELAAALPGVQAAAVTTGAPPFIGSLSSANRAEAEGEPPPEGVHRSGPTQGASDVEFLNVIDVTDDYFRTLGIPVVQGRPFAPSDASADVAIISDDFARRFWHGASPIGRRLRPRASGPWLTIVGVVPDVLQTGLDGERGRLEIYYPMAQSRPGRPRLYILLRGDIEAAVIPVLRARLRAVDPQLPISSVATLADVLSGDLAGPRFNLILLVGFASMAVALAAVGIYGVLAYNVAQRRREIGVRMALGARPADVLQGVVATGMLLAGVGLATGGLGSWGLTRFMRSMLFEVEPLDPVTLLAAAALLAMIALTACIVPARRATHVDPVVSLRAE